MAITAKSLKGLDLGNVVQDAQTIASQTTLEALLVTVMKVCAKYTGAQKGLLLLNENEQLQVKATFTGSSDEILVLQAIPSITFKQFPQSIIDNTYKSNVVITLNYATNRDDFADDPYLLHHQPAFVCCAPICYQENKFGVVYLEKSPDTTGFGAENVEFLQTLLAQTAISLRNMQENAQFERENDIDDYSLLFKHAPAGFAYARIIVDKSGTPADYQYLDVNIAFEKMLGRKREDVIGKTVTEVFPEVAESEIDWIAECGKVALTGEEKTIEHHAALYDLWYKVTIYSPKKEYFVTVFEDITQRKYAEQALHKEYNFRTAIIEFAAEGLCVCHECDNHPFVEFTVWNNRMEEITGYTMDEINQKGWYQAMYPDPDLQNRAIERMSRMRTGDDLQSEPWEITRADGEKRILNITTSILLSNDGNVHVLGLMDDVTTKKKVETALRESEQRFRTIFETAGIGVALCTLEGEFLQINPAYQAMVGYSAAELVGKTFFELTHPDDIDIQEEKQRTALSQHPPESYQFEKRYICKDGQVIWVRVITSFIIDNHGNPQYGLGLVEDITKDKESTEALTRYANEMTALYETSLEINSEQDIPTLFQTIVDRAANLLDTKMATLALVRPDNITLEIVTVLNRPKERVGLIINSGQGIAGHIIKTGQPLMVSNYAEWDDRIVELPNKGIGKMLGVPLKQGGRITGVLNVFDEQVGEFTENQVQLLSLFAAYVTIVVEKAHLLEAARRRAEQLEALRQVSQDLMLLQNLETLLLQITERTLQLLDRTHGGVALYRPSLDKLEWVVKIDTGLLLPTGAMIERNQGVAGKVWDTLQTVIVNDYQNWDGKLVDKPDHFAAVIGSPIQWGADFLGVIIVTDTPENPFTYEDADLLTQFSVQAAVAIQNANLLNELQQRLRELSGLHEIAEAFGVLTDARETFGTLAERMAKLVGAETCVVVLLNPKSKEMQAQKPGYGVSDELLVKLRFSQTKARDFWDFREKGTFMANSPKDMPSFLANIASEFGVENAATAPMWVGRKIVGQVMAGNKPGGFKEDDAKLLSVFANQAAIVVQNARLYQQIQHHNLELERSNQELQEFAYIASHDLQEPLRKIQTFGQRLETKYGHRLDSTGLDYIERMRGAASRMQILIEDLLTFSRITTRAQPYARVALNEIVQEVLLDLETLVDDVDGHIKADNLPVIEADPTQMRQLFQNLIGNGLKFHRPEVAPIIYVKSKRKNNGYYQISVEDNGIGFDEKYADRIFGMFQRLHSRSQYKGTGVGLAVCKKIAERHNGTITAYGKPDNGAIFTITLPIKQSHRNKHVNP